MPRDGIPLQIGRRRPASTLLPLVRLLAAIIALLLAPAPAGAEEAPTTTQELKAQQSNLFEIYKLANSLPNQLVDLQATIDTLADISAVAGQLPEIATQIEAMKWEGANLKTNPNLSFHVITAFESKLGRINRQLEKLNRPIRANIATLEARHQHWLTLEKQLQEITDRITTEFKDGDPFPEIHSLKTTLASGRELINNNLRDNLTAGYEIGKLQTQTYGLDSIASEMLTEMNRARQQQTSRSMLSADFYKMINRQLLVDGLTDIHLFFEYQLDYLTANIVFIVLAALIVVVLAALVNLSRKLVASASSWTRFANRPLTTSIFISTLIFSLVDPLFSPVDLPPDWITLLFLPLLFAVAVLSDNIFSARWQVTLIRWLFLFSGISLILSVMSLPRVLFHLFVFYASIGLLAYYLLTLFRVRSAPWARGSWLAALITGIFPALIIVAGISGYDQLAGLYFSRILFLIAITITFRLMLLFVSALLELLIHHVPWRFIKNNATAIVRQLIPLLALLHFIFWIAAVLVILWVYPSLKTALEALVSIKFTILSVTVTPGSILSVVLIVYLTLLLSRGLRAFLLQEALPRQRVEKGVQLSITRLVHYAVMTIGFLVLLRALGFGLNQITILGGALGVGIGFGLQAIVNNFVSGLILLFERPIKVGDVIDVGTQVGEVKELGLRATIVQTFDNAEVVIPNSELVSASVTNWTLANKKVRVRVPVGVAYGSDIEAVLRILLACAGDSPSVLGTPKPVALFLAFGASSLDFELRVWINDFNDKLMVLSELNQEIDAEFRAAGIEIPFPQTDLHLRTVEPRAAEMLFRPRTEPSPPDPADS